ncbi:hypothetical protein HZZ02_07515 [Streptococcus danieliae]|nr:hypothetical protein [Streptococcus danieliae]
MKLKTFSDKAKTYTFTYDFPDFETARVANNALFGYMIGTYEQSVLETTFEGNGRMVVEYVEDRNINRVFKRICDGFKDYCNQPEE